MPIPNWKIGLFNDIQMHLPQLDAQKLLENVPVIEIKPKMDNYSDWFEEEDVEKIKEFNLDVIIRRGFRILKGDILNAAKYGVWSYHHDDNTVIRGVPRVSGRPLKEWVSGE